MEGEQKNRVKNMFSQEVNERNGESFWKFHGINLTSLTWGIIFLAKKVQVTAIIRKK